MTNTDRRFELQVRSHRYDSVGFCIYCGDAENKLTTEHIISHGIGGRLELPLASCLRCNKITSALESHFQNEVIGDLKTILRFPRRRGHIKRGNIPVQIKVENGRFQQTSVPSRDAPSYIMLPEFQVPEMILGEAWTDDPPLMKVIVVNPRAGLGLVKEHGEFRSAKIRFNATSFGLMLAKTAHGYAFAEFRQTLGGMKSTLSNLITSGTDRFPRSLIGGYHAAKNPPTDMLHNISAMTTNANNREMLVVRLQLFAHWGTPTYDIVVATRDAR